MFARRGDGACWADIKTTGAGGLFGAGMGAEDRFEFHIKRLFKRADHLARLEHGVGQAVGARRVGAQVAFAFFMGREQGLSAAQIEDDVAFAVRAIARVGHGEGAASARDDLLKGVEGDGETAQCALCGTQPPADHVVIAGGRNVVRCFEQDGHAKHVLQPFGCLKGNVGRPQDQAQTVGRDIDGFGRGRGQQGLRRQGGHFGGGVGVVGPACAVAQIKRGRRGDAKLRSQVLENAEFLGAADDRVFTGDLGRSCFQILAAKF